MEVTKNELVTPKDYDRDVRNYDFSMKGTDLAYEVGDCLAVLPQNPKEEVEKCLEIMNINGD